MRRQRRDKEGIILDCGDWPRKGFSCLNRQQAVELLCEGMRLSHEEKQEKTSIEGVD